MKWLVRLVLVVWLVLVVLGSCVFWWLSQPLSMSVDNIDFSVESGMTPREIAQGLVVSGVDAPDWAIYAWFRWSGQASHIKAGNYALEKGDTPKGLLKKLVQGDANLLTLRLNEGWTFKQVRAVLAISPGLKPDTMGLSDEDIMIRLNRSGLNPEGHFYPDTYAYSKGVSDLVVLKRAMSAMDQHLQDVWKGRASDIVVQSPDELLILASIVEKETGTEGDRALVSAVFTRFDIPPFSHRHFQHPFSLP